MALQESKDQCLPVREIYEWIEVNFPFYMNVSKNGGWKSSIRHNLSFSKCFKKVERRNSVVVKESDDDVDEDDVLSKPVILPLKVMKFVFLLNNLILMESLFKGFAKRFHDNIGGRSNAGWKRMEKGFSAFDLEGAF